jgi:hypothetical protein
MEENESSSQTPITWEELQLRIHHPPSINNTLMVREAHPETSLSYIPWTVRQSIKLCADDDVPSSSAPSSDRKFPAFSYLDLRRHQNRAWANDRLTKGNEQYYLNPEQADKFYQEGIDLVPDHVDLLVAQAKLWMMRRNRPHAAKIQLQEALQFDPTHAEANELMTRLERHEAARREIMVNRQHQPQTRESSVYQDVLMERNLAMVNSEPQNEEELSRSDDSSRKRSRRHKTKKPKKKHRRRKKETKKKGRKRRRRFHSSSSSSSASEESSVGTSSGSEQGGSDGNEEEVQRRTRKRRRRKRHDSEASSMVDSESVKSKSMERNADGPNDDRGGEATSSNQSQRRHKKRSRSDRHKSKRKKKHRQSETADDSSRNNDG